MTAVHALTETYKVAIQAGFWVAFVFPFVTSLFWPWWMTWWGRNLMALDVVIMLALLPGTLQIEFGLIPGHTPGHVLLWTTAVSLCLVPVILVWRMVMIFQAQSRGMRRDRGSAADS